MATRSRSMATASGSGESTRPRALSSAETTTASSISADALLRRRSPVCYGAIKRPVSCSPIDRDQYGRTVATCSLGAPGPDIGHWLVSNGHALDWPKYSKGKYEDAQRSAEKANRGIWAGSFAEPWRYRACMKAGGRPAACSDEANDRR